MAKSLSTEKKAKYFFHYYRNDFHRTTAVLVGDVDAAAPEIHKTWKSREHADKILEHFRSVAREFDYTELVGNKSGRTLELEGGGTFLVWFPVIPCDHTLVHELLHCVQFMCNDLRIQDDEYEAYMLEALFEHFQPKFREDSKVPFEPPMKTIIED